MPRSERERLTAGSHRARRWRAALWTGLLWASIPLGSRDASANGRFPRSQRLIEDPTNADHLLLAATFGILTTSDRGKHWYDYCEAAFAQDATYAGDPILERVAGGALLVDVQSSINRSADGCGWAPTLGSAATAATETIEDFAVDRATGTTIVALVTRVVSGATTIALAQSDDAGATWNTIGTAVPASMVFTVDLDPTDATHIYVTGLSTTDRTGIFLTTINSGSTWSSSPIPNTSLAEAPYIAAVNPQNPQQIYIRTDAWILPAGAPEQLANDALLYSSDGGATWTELLRESAKLLGFALSPDGTSVLAGYGDPVEAGYDVDPTAMGIYQASNPIFAFTPVFSLDATGANANITCLTWTAAGTYACMEESTLGTYEELAFFGNGTLDLDGGAPLALMELNQVGGPPPCCAATDALCSWPAVCQMYPFFSCAGGGASAVACVDAGVVEPAPDASTQATHDASVSNDSGPGNATAPRDAAADTTSPAGPPSGGHSQSSGGCSAASGPPQSETDVLWALGAAVVLAESKRRRRQRD